jgi:sporulation protein YlmC with PRC-barrel domain
MMRGADLQGKPLRDENGQAFGRVDEVHIRDGEVIALTCGGAGLLQRFMNSRAGHRIDWSRVLRVTAKEIVIAKL